MIETRVEQRKGKIELMNAENKRMTERKGKETDDMQERRREPRDDDVGREKKR